MAKEYSINELKERIGKEAIKCLPKSGIINVGYGIPSTYLIPVMEKNENLLVHAESCVTGIHGEGKNPYIVDPAGTMVGIHKNGFISRNITDAFSIINRGKIKQTYLGALQVAVNGDIANWAASEDEKYGIGGAAELCRGAKEVIVLMLEYTKNGERKLVRECTMPLTAKSCVTKIITEFGVYAPYKKDNGDYIFRVLKAWDEKNEKYVKIRDNIVAPLKL